MNLKIMELETKIAELELEIIKWNRDIEDIYVGLTLQMEEQFRNLSNSLDIKKTERERAKEE